MIGLLTLAKREIVRFLVVYSQTVVPPWVSALLYLLIFGVTVGGNIDLGPAHAGYLEFMIPGLVTMYLISSSYENTSSSLFISRWHNLVQELLVSPLSYMEMVLGLLAGGIARGLIVGGGVWVLSMFFSPLSVAHPFWLIYFAFCITFAFSLLGLLAALWAENFGMLGLWNTYVISPLVFLGGVFSPIELIPNSLRWFVVYNPMYYLVSGIRYSLSGQPETSLGLSAGLAGISGLVLFALTVHLFKIGYKLRK